jgi:leucyl-tRNA synthetase
MFDHADLQRWLPTAQTVEDADANVSLLDMRTIAKALRDAGALELADGEPHGATLVHAPLQLGDAPASELLEAHGSDAVRFALLLAAAPTKAFAGDDAILRQSSAFLSELRSFAEARLGGVGPDARLDAEDGLRRRLAGWCDTAAARVAENYERLDAHRATRNVMELLTRIQDFERRVLDHRGEMAGADREALALALLTLVRLMAPMAPRLAEELWQSAGAEGGVADAGWPTPQREPAAA